MDSTRIFEFVSNRVGVPTEVRSVVTDTGSVYMPRTTGEYWQFRRFIHDVFCASLIDNGTYDVFEFQLSTVGLQVENKRLSMQKPDLARVADAVVDLCEVSVTYNPEQAMKEKSVKYIDLVNFLNDNGYESKLDLLIVDISDPEWPDSFPSMSESFVSVIDRLLDNLRIIHSDPKFSIIRKKELGQYNLDRLQYVLEDETVTSHVKEATDVTIDAGQFYDMIDKPMEPELSDDRYIDTIAESILSSKAKTRPYPTPEPVNPITMKTEFQSLFDTPPNTKKIPKILQLGSPKVFCKSRKSIEEQISILKNTHFHGGYLDHIKNAIEHSRLEVQGRGVMLSLSIQGAQLRKEQLEGPGRKSLLKREGMTIPREAPRHIGVSEEHSRVLRSLIDSIEKETTTDSVDPLPILDFQETGPALSDILESVQDVVDSSGTSSLLKFYQSISTEIVLNSMRRRKRGEYLLCSSGMEKIWVLIAPGPQLRTETNVEFVKIISLVEPISNISSEPWVTEGDHWESSWVSVDIDRLKHWQRSFDRVTLSMLANSERLVRPGTNTKQAVKLEVRTGNYALLAMTYLEDKNMTSVTNQTIRYLWMKSLGDKDFKGIASKFPARVNSVIQSHMILNSVKTCEKVCKMSLNDLVKVRKLKRDEDLGTYDETTTGVTSLLPRLFTYGGDVPISYNLNEIYWCMAYNKDRQNQTQDSMKIITKIVKEEQKYNDEINKRTGLSRVRYFLGQTSVEEDVHHIHSEKPESHFYSARAVRIGLFEQDNHLDNVGSGGSWMNDNKLEQILSKPLSEYATFKASVKEIAWQLNPNDLEDVKKLGRRTKAIELISEIVSTEDLMSAADVVMKYTGSNNMNFSIFIQIFKKGQIGGVREIIILYIKARIMVNITEEISRALCKSDKREILTKGRDKRLMMRGDFEEVTSKFPAGTPLAVIKESFDMSVWCQKFIPMIFSQIHRMHLNSHPGVKALCTHVFLAHSNKTIEYPRKMVEQWMKHPEVVHQEGYMQSRKEKFLKDGKPYIVNHSNMCQGILHYSSSVLALSCVSLRDKIFERCLKILGQTKAISWKTRVGSDDKGTIMAVDLSSPNGKLQSRLLGQCEHAAERLHSMELSIKSASGHVMYELNSAFMANLETLSPTIKYTLAAVDCIGTTSCAEFVNESFSRIRQMRENGCSSFLCSVAHSLNKKHFYGIFDTQVGGVNDLTKVFSLPHNKIPFDFGVYPVYDCDLHELIGPEYHNYRLFSEAKSRRALALLYKPMSPKDEDSLIPDDAEGMLKKDHFGVKQGLVRQLLKMRERVGASSNEVEEFFIENPFLIIRGPQTTKELKMMIHSKLFTKGAAQSLRRTNAAIYIGRIGAFRSTEAWERQFVETVGYDVFNNEDVYNVKTVRMTYKEFIASGLEELDDLSVEKVLSSRTILFPNYKSLDVCNSFLRKFGAMRTSSLQYSQAIRTWTINNFNYEYTSGLRDILLASFGESDKASREDVEELRKSVNMDMSSLERVKEECKRLKIRPLDFFFHLNKIHKLSRTSRVQAFAHGSSTRSLHMTLLNLKRYNHISGSVSNIESSLTAQDVEFSNDLSAKSDLVKLGSNILLMIKLGSLQGTKESSFNFSIGDTDFFDTIRTIIRSTKSISNFDFQTQKNYKFALTQLMSPMEVKEKIVSWKSLNFSYIRRQRKVISKNGNVSWTGDLEVLVSLGSECFTIHINRGDISVVTRQVTDRYEFNQALRNMSKVLNIEYRDFFRRMQVLPGDYYLSPGDRQLHQSLVATTGLDRLSLRIDKKFRFKRVSDLDSFKIINNVPNNGSHVEVYLQDGTGRTATVCHMSAVYNPVEIPSNFVAPDGLKFFGVDFNFLSKNRQWFYNFSLPTVSDTELAFFHRDQVDYNELSKFKEDEMTKIKDYIEVTEEVDYDTFDSLRENMELEAYQDVFDPSTDFNTMFRLAMIEIGETNTGFAQNLTEGFRWEDEEFDDMNEDTKPGEIKFGEDDATVSLMRSLGYKKPARKRNNFLISGLQHASVTKLRVLNSYFKMSSISSESTQSLVQYHKWLELCSHETSLNKDLRLHIRKTIKERTGTHMNEIQRRVTNLPQSLSSPLMRYFNAHVLSPEDVLSVMDSLMEEAAFEDAQSDYSDDL